MIISGGADRVRQFGIETGLFGIGCQIIEQRCLTHGSHYVVRIFARVWRFGVGFDAGY